jgi:Tfp pilus assembly protein PilF
MPRHRESLLAALGLAALTAAAFGPACDNGFVSLDDQTYVVGNPHVRKGLTADDIAWAFGTSFHAGNWHPLTWLSLQADATLFGTGPAGFHRTNVALHAANVLLLFLCLLRLTGRLWPSAVVAALFAVHPLRAESVAWVAERKDVLSALFGLLALLAYTGYAAAPAAGRYALVAILFALSLLAKPMLVTLPCLLLLLDWWPLGRVQPLPAGKGGPGPPAPIRALVREKVPLLLLAGASCAMTWQAQRATAVSSLEHIPLAARVANALVSYAAYLGQTFWPAGLAPFYPFEGDKLSGAVVALSAALLVAVSAVVVARGRARPYLAVGWLWYLGMLVPVIGLVQVGAQARADRYTYLPLVGIYLLTVWGLDELAGRLRLRPAALGLAGAAIAALALLCREQVRVWHDDRSLWDHALGVTGENWRALHGVGLADERAGRTAEAIERYRRAIELNPQNADLRGRLGDLWHATGHYQEARESYTAALRIDPDFAQVHANLGSLLRKLGDREGALEHLRRAIDLEPNSSASAQAYYNLGRILEEQGRPDEAAEALKKAVRLDPGLAALLNRRGR